MSVTQYIYNIIIFLHDMYIHSNHMLARVSIISRTCACVNRLLFQIIRCLLHNIMLILCAYNSIIS